MQYPSKRRDYYREYLKELMEYGKPFLITGTYAPPMTTRDAHFCCFKDIKPYVYGARSKMLTSHIHITRSLCEQWYDRFTVDMAGKSFILCVRPYIYEENRAGLELTSKLREWIEPVFPASWYKGPLDVFSRIPEDKFLDFRFTQKRWHYLEDISTYQHVGKKVTLAKPKTRIKRKKYDPCMVHPEPNVNGRPPLDKILNEIKRIRALAKTKTGRSINEANGIYLDDQNASSRLQWLLDWIKPWPWTKWEFLKLLEKIGVHPNTFPNVTNMSFEDWCAANHIENDILEDNESRP